MRKIMWKYGLGVCLLLPFLMACRSGHRLDAALEFAGDNRSELERVLAYYKDSGQKYDAARFLIENMPMYYSYEGDALDSAKAALGNAGGDGVVARDIVDRWKTPQGLRKVYDSHVITASFLIDNIDRSFLVWKNRPWNKYLSFDDFCELILPYRLGNEPLEEWRKLYMDRYSFLIDSVYRGTDVIEAAAEVARYLKQENFVYNWDFSLPNQGASFLLRHRIGTCRDACDLTLYVMRSLGIPAAVDNYAYSSETRKGHTWNVVRDTTGNYWGVWFTDRELERGRIYSDGRKAGKVYRTCFGVPQSRDVSADYYPDTLRLRVAERNPEALFIGVFHPHGWIPIDVAQIKNGMAVFPNVESEVIYAPLVNEGDKYREVDYPFLFDGKDIHPYIPDLLKRDTVTLWRKHTFFSWIKNRLGKLYHARIEFSERKDFCQIGYSHFIPDTPRICHTEVRFPVPLRCRYVRYCAARGKRTEISEFQFYGNGGQYHPLSVRGEEPLSLLTPAEYAFDDDPLSYYATKVPGATFFIDFGKSVEIERFVIMPRNDDNFIRVGDTYELFYHGGSRGWLSLGCKTATEPKLVYDNMPHGALFHLRCLTRGIEEQVFHIENGKQVFVSNQGVDL